MHSQSPLANISKYATNPTTVHTARILQSQPDPVIFHDRGQTLSVIVCSKPRPAKLSAGKTHGWLPLVRVTRYLYFWFGNENPNRFYLRTNNATKWSVDFRYTNYNVCKCEVERNFSRFKDTLDLKYTALYFSIMWKTQLDIETNIMGEKVLISPIYRCTHTIICHCRSPRLPIVVCPTESFADDHCDHSLDVPRDCPRCVDCTYRLGDCQWSLFNILQCKICLIFNLGRYKSNITLILWLHIVCYTKNNHIENVINTYCSSESLNNTCIYIYIYIYR